MLYGTYLATTHPDVTADWHFSSGVYAAEELGKHSAPWESRSLANLAQLYRLPIAGVMLFKSACLTYVQLFGVFLRSKCSPEGRRGQTWAVGLWREERWQSRSHCSMISSLDCAPALPGHRSSKPWSADSRGDWDRLLWFFCGESPYSCSGLRVYCSDFFFTAIAQMCTVSILRLK